MIILFANVLRKLVQLFKKISVANGEVVTMLRNVLCWVVLMKVPMAQILRAAQHAPGGR